MRFPERPTIYLDVSLMMGNRLNTGIQRVVRNLAAVAPQVCDEFRYNCRLIQCVGGQFYRLRYNLIDHQSQQWVSKLVRRRLGRRVMDKAIPQFSSPLEPLEMDRVITLNGTWDQPQWLHRIEQLTRQCHVSSVIHDLIPITHPQFHTAELRRRFSHWFEGLVARVPNLIATSSTGRQQILQWLKDHGPEGLVHPRVSQFRLTSGLESSTVGKVGVTHVGRPDGLIRESLRQFLQASSPVILAVGTIEPRKNHQQLLDACSRLWADGWNGRLLLLGGRGWDCDPVMSELQRHGDRILHLADGTDAELIHAYEHASAMVFASWTEGFGLPIVEALSRGLGVLLSDTPIHREVAGEAGVYFRLDDPQDLGEALLQHESQGFQSLRQRTSHFQPVSCFESFRTLLCDAIVAGRGFRAEVKNVAPWLKGRQAA